MTATITQSGGWRKWLPLYFLLACVIVQIAIGVMLWSERMERTIVYRPILEMASIAMVAFTGLLLVMWFVFWSRFTWAVVSVGVVLLVGGLALAVYALRLDKTRVTGDMTIIWPRPRWLPSNAEMLKRHRESQGKFEGEVSNPLLLGNGELDYPEYRGRNRDGLIKGGPILARDWSTLPKEIWRQPVGDGHSAFAVAGPLAITMEQREEQEAVVAYDTATGKERWVHAYPTRFFEALGGLGPRSTPTINNGDVFAFGAEGKLTCLDAATGKLKWDVDALERSNDNVTWGMSGSPLVVDNLVVVNPGYRLARPARGTLAAYDRANGTQLWSAGKAHAGYSSPMVATLAGKKQILLFDGEGLSGYDPADKGRELWRIPWEVEQRIIPMQPLVVDGDRVFISSGYGVGCAMLKITQENGIWKVETLWKNRLLKCKFTSPVLHEGHLYGLDEGILVCLDAKTGTRQWRGQRYGHGQLILCQGLLIVMAENCDLVLLEAKPQEPRELGRFTALEGRRTWNLPALANGRVYLRNDEEMACYDLTAGK